MPLNSQSSKSDRQSGLTLLEAILSTAILGTSILAGLQLFEVQQDVFQLQNDDWEVTCILQREMQLVRATPYELLETTSFATLASHPSYQIRRVVSLESAEISRVVIEARWRSDKTGKIQTEYLVTLRAKGVNYGL